LDVTLEGCCYLPATSHAASAEYYRSGDKHKHSGYKIGGEGDCFAGEMRRER
jgi:hypothetical protein